jgi:hypothetical protein
VGVVNRLDKFVYSADDLKTGAVYELHKRERSTRFYKQVGRLFKLTEINQTQIKFMSSSAPRWGKVNLVEIPLTDYGTVWVAKKA